MRKDGSHVIVTAFAFVTAIAIGAEADDPSTPTCEALAERIGEIMSADQCDAELDRLKAMAGECSNSHAGVRSALSALAGWAAKHPECVPEDDLDEYACKSACEAGGGIYDGGECTPPVGKVTIGCFVVEMPERDRVPAGRRGAAPGPKRRPAPPPDADGDGVDDWHDNCIRVMNGPRQADVPRIGNQTDSDGDGIGDACQYATRNELEERHESTRKWIDALSAEDVGDPQKLRDLIRSMRERMSAERDGSAHAGIWKPLRSLILAIEHCRAHEAVPLFGMTEGERPVMFVRKCLPDQALLGVRSEISGHGVRIGRLEERRLWPGVGLGFGAKYYLGSPYSEFGVRLDGLLGISNHLMLRGGVSLSQASEGGGTEGKAIGASGGAHFLTGAIDSGTRIDIGIGLSRDEVMIDGARTEFAQTAANLRPGLFLSPAEWLAVRVYGDLAAGICYRPGEPSNGCSSVGFGVTANYLDR